MRDGDPIELGEISVDFSEFELRVTLLGGPNGPQSCTCEVWEHTIYELEILYSALRRAAAQEFPPTIDVDTPASRLFATLGVSTTAHIEVGLSLKTPSANRAVFFCTSKIQPRGRALAVIIGLTIAGTFSEVLAEPRHARELADWLEAQVAHMWELSDAEDEEITVKPSDPLK